MLTGTPIDGALLGTIVPYTWSRAIVFSGVRSIAPAVASTHPGTFFIQATMLVGACIVFIARVYLAKRKGTQFI